MRRIFKREAHQVSMFLVALFAVCFAWYFIHPVDQSLHLSFFRMMFFGFKEMNLIGFILGVVQSYIWGYIFVWIWEAVGRNKK